MPRDSHQKAAEFHQAAAHAHLAAIRDGKQDHQTAHDQSRQALEHSVRAFSESQEAHQRSANHIGETNDTAGVNNAK